jgi:methylmalonyl-CoA mutase cobalamin-binding subunit
VSEAVPVATHVIAGNVVARTLAEHGAEVVGAIIRTPEEWAGRERSPVPVSTSHGAGVSSVWLR